VTQEERATRDQVAALLPDGEYDEQLAAGRGQTLDDALIAAGPILEGRPVPVSSP